MRTALVQLAACALACAGAQQVYAQVSAKLGQGKDAYEQQDYAAAELLLQEALTENPADQFAATHLGASLYKQGKHAEAIAAFQSPAILCCSQAYCRALCGQALAYEALGQTDDAAAARAKAIASCSPQRIANAYRWLGAADRVGAVFDEVLAQTPTDERTRRQKEKLAALVAGPAAYEAWLVAHAAKKPKDLQRAVNYAEFLLKQGRPGEVPTTLEPLLAARKNKKWPYGPALLLVAEAYEQTGDAESAADVYQQLEDDLGLDRAANTYRAAGRHAAAAALYARHLAAKPTDAEAALWRGVSLSKAGRHDEAVAQLTTAVDRGWYTKAHRDGLYQLALSCKHVGCDAEALAALQDIDAFYPDAEGILPAKVLAASLGAQPRDAAQEQLEREAWKLFHAASQEVQTLRGDLRDTGATPLSMRPQLIDDLQAVSAVYPTTRAARAARKLLVAELGKDPNQVYALTEESELLVAELGASHPGSKEHVKTGRRLAKLYHEQGRVEDAMTAHLAAIAAAPAPDAKLTAQYHASQAFFKTIVDQVYTAARPATPAEWQFTQALSDGTVAGVHSEDRAVFAEHVHIDVLHWRGKYAEALAAAEALIAEYDEVEHRSHVGHAHIAAGECLQSLGRPEEALAHFEWVTERFTRDNDIWPGADLSDPKTQSVARAYFRIYQLKTYAGLGTRAEGLAIGQYVIDEFPESLAAQLIQRTFDRDAATAQSPTGD